MSTPANPIVLENRFREVAEQIATEARTAATMRDDLDKQIAEVGAQDQQDEAEQKRLEAHLAQIKQRRAERATWMAERVAMHRTASTATDRLEADHRRALAVVEQIAGGQQQEAERPVASSGAYPAPTGPMPTMPDGLGVQDGDRSS
ncbi:MAG: hypothetical protein ACRDP6_24595 [Actinoallomurus sp.]